MVPRGTTAPLYLADKISVLVLFAVLLFGLCLFNPYDMFSPKVSGNLTNPDDDLSAVLKSSKDPSASCTPGQPV
jgi:hypothetical protein